MKFIDHRCVCVLALAGCGKSGKTDQDILLKISQANTNEALVKTFGKVGYRYEYLYGDGSQETEYLYVDADRFVRDNQYVTFYDDGTNFYGIDHDKNTYFTNMFVDNSRDYFMAVTEVVSNYVYIPDKEKVESVKEENGVTKIETSVTDQAMIADMCEGFGYEKDQVESLKYHYEIESKTYILSSITGIYHMSDGSEVTYMKNQIERNPETLVPDEKLMEAVSGTDMRTITVNVDAGTDQAKSYTFESWKGVRVDVILPASYEQALYMDETYMTKSQAGKDNTADVVRYARSKAE